MDDGKPLMTPYESVAAAYELPFPLYPFQVEIVNDLGTKPQGGYWMDPGIGKTATSTVVALYLKRQTLVVLPPILGVMWCRWLRRIKGVTATHYAGTPKKRAEMKLDTDFVVMGMQIFKKDFDSVLARMDPELTVIVDEATSIKNVGSDNHKAVAHLIRQCGAYAMFLSGTPLSKPDDAYAYIKLIAPGTYRNLHHFENVHIAERDFFGNVTEWKNIDLLHANMKINSVRVIKSEVLMDLPPVIITPIHYQLDPKHYRLYQKLATEELLELENGGKIDATTVQALFHGLQQIILNYATFSDNPADIAAGIDLLDEVVDELGGEKLVVFTNYRMTNTLLAEHTARKYKGRTIFGGVSAKQQQAALDAFIDDPEVKTLTLQIQSGGMGIDNLQHVANNILFLEFPTLPAWFHQAVARLHRGGQTKNVNVRVAIAEGTTQVRRFNELMDRDQLINRIVRSMADLRDVVFGVS